MLLSIRLTAVLLLLVATLGGSSLISTQGARQVAQLQAAPKLDIVPPSPLTLPKGGKLPIAIVIGANAEVLDFCGPLEVFSFAYTDEGEQAFDPYIVAQSLEPVTVGGGMKVLPQHSFDSAPQPKVIVIPAMSEDAVTPEMLAWIRKATANTDVTMSVCNGAFVLARTGLLDGKDATAHHGGYFRFAGNFLNVKLKRGARFVEDGNLASAGGVSSGIDLALRVVHRYMGQEAANRIADGIEYQGKGWLDPNSNESYAKFQETNEEHPICPLCQMVGDKSLKTTHQGKNYYFCHESEKKFFDEHLDVVDRFLKEDSMASTKTYKPQ